MISSLIISPSWIGWPNIQADRFFIADPLSANIGLVLYVILLSTSNNWLLIDKYLNTMSLVQVEENGYIFYFKV